MNFDRLAPHYDWLEALTAGNRLDRARQAWLPELRDRPRILTVGEGHGRFAAACRARFPNVELVAVEASAAMLRRARRHFARRGLDANQVTWIHASWPEWTPAPATFDAIVTCFFLDCFPPETLPRVIGSLAAGATNDAVWVNVDFAMPDRGFARWRALAAHRLMYGFFRAVTRLPASRLTSPDTLLAARGFQLAQRREWDWGLIRADHWRRASTPAASPT